MNLLSDAHKSAQALDTRLSSDVKAIKLESARKLFYRLQNYLVEQCRNHSTVNDVYSKIRFQAADSKGVALILLGPSIDKGSSHEHVHLDSGGRLSFLVAVREEGGGTELVSFRFHFQLADSHSLPYLRFDLNNESHAEPLGEPRCHLHLGIEDVRVPIPILHPVEILDRIFFIIEPKLIAHK